ncbi:voltage-gated chloride channel protein [Stylonychia lemnae]|uniref:Voltage-gated chloride channel protein n=1 Tax=Stylonychia lemnae TaxID=5949 RepID=A0A078B8D1_STYLE|nr:voltage-gated chloride channel protein [Stylonychia lemnae]|eukprot:CDW90775.1 voltage-gated chloride channel protein [Stylonychia lemnae]
MYELKDLNSLDVKLNFLQCGIDEFSQTSGIRRQLSGLRSKSRVKVRQHKLIKFKGIDVRAQQNDLFGNLKVSNFMFLVILGASTALQQLIQQFSQEQTCTQRYVQLLDKICMLDIVQLHLEYYSRDSEGSSLPEMKAVLAGVHISTFLSIRAFIGKLVGVTVAIVGGLSLGRYGSFVHMSGVIAHQMSYRIKFFQNIGSNYQLRLQVISAAIAAGTCCSAGSPFGGVIFALELTSTYYMMGNMWKGLLCTTAAIITYSLMHQLPFVKPPKLTDFEEYTFNHEIIFFIILGYLCARVGALFIHILTKIIFLRGKLKNPLLLNRWKWCSIVILFISIIQFPLRFLHFPERQVWNVMFNSHQISEVQNGQVWSNPNLELVLLVYCILKFIFIVSSLTLPLPNGIFAPMISFGAVFGRLFDEGIYAVVGATCVYGSVTKTVSIAIIIFEVTGQITLLVPVVIGLSVAYASSQAMTMSIFDVLLEFKNFPFLPTLGEGDTIHLKARDIMNRNFVYLREDSEIREIRDILTQFEDFNYDPKNYIEYEELLSLEKKLQADLQEECSKV